MKPPLHSSGDASRLNGVAPRSHTGQYAPSSRLVSRAPHRSRCDAGFHHGLLDVRNRISKWDSETRGQDLGLHGGVWVDVGISDRFGLVFGAEGAYANVSGLSGFREGTFSYRSPVRDDGTLRLTKITRDTDLLIVGNGSWLDDRYGPITPGRDANLGLSGVRLSVGLRIGL